MFSNRDVKPAVSEAAVSQFLERAGFTNGAQPDDGWKVSFPLLFVLPTDVVCATAAGAMANARARTSPVLPGRIALLDGPKEFSGACGCWEVWMMEGAVRYFGFSPEEGPVFVGQRSITQPRSYQIPDLDLLFCGSDKLVDQHFSSENLRLPITGGSPLEELRAPDCKFPWRSRR